MMIDNVLIVIPCLNEILHIEGLVRQIFRAPLPDRRLVVVADGGSSDGTLEILTRLCTEFPDLRVLPNPDRLQAAGINLAVEKYGSGFDYMLRLDAHATYPDNYLERLGQLMIEKGAQSVVVPMTSYGDSAFQKGVASAQNTLLGSGGSAHRLEGRSAWVDHGHHALINLAWFRRIGGYNPAFGHNEDAEMDVRLIRDGGRIWLAGDVAIGYYPRRDPVSLFKQYYRYGAGRSRTVQLHHTPLKLRQLAPISIAPICILALFGWVSWVLEVPALCWAFVAIAFGIYLAVKAKSASVALSGPAAMVMHLAWSAGYWSQIRPSKHVVRRWPEPASVKGYDVLLRAKLIGKPVRRPAMRPMKLRDANMDFSNAAKEPSSAQ